MSSAEFVYTVLLKPQPLKLAANWLIRRVIPDRLSRHGAVIHLNPDDPVISGALTFGLYEKPETSFFLSACRPGITVVDIGANVGYYTALAIARLQNQGRIVSFEPDPDSHSFLQKTIGANQGTIVTPLRKAVADREGRMSLFVSSQNRGDNRLYANELATGAVDVEVVTLDSELARLQIQQVDLIKIDVQGYERRAFAGMEETLRRSTDLVILTEFWPDGLRRAGDTPLEVLDFLADRGFRSYQLDENGNVKRIRDARSLIAQYSGRKYTNLVAVKGRRLPGDLEDA